jgi:hypothetical protein
MALSLCDDGIQDGEILYLSSLVSSKKLRVFGLRLTTGIDTKSSRQVLSLTTPIYASIFIYSLSSALEFFFFLFYYYYHKRDGGEFVRTQHLFLSFFLAR